MKKLLASVVIVVLASARSAIAVPVVPNFQQGSMTSRTETQSTVQETINSIDYRTGWEYSVTGVGIENGQNPVNPNVTNSTVYVSPGMTAANGRQMWANTQQKQPRTAAGKYISDRRSDSHFSLNSDPKIGSKFNLK